MCASQLDVRGLPRGRLSNAAGRLPADGTASFVVCRRVMSAEAALPARRKFDLTLTNVLRNTNTTTIQSPTGRPSRNMTQLLRQYSSALGRLNATLANVTAILAANGTLAAPVVPLSTAPDALAPAAISAKLRPVDGAVRLPSGPLRARAPALLEGRAKKHKAAAVKAAPKAAAKAVPPKAASKQATAQVGAAPLTPFYDGNCAHR